MKPITLYFIFGVLCVHLFGTTKSSISVDSTDGNFICPTDWILRDVKCYKLFTDLKTFGQAEEYCQTNNGGHLTSVTSQTEHAFLLDYILRELNQTQLNYVWVGGLRKRTRYIWTDLEPFVYQDWHAAQKTYSDLDKYPTFNCVQFVTTSAQYLGDPQQFGKLVNHPCNGLVPFICQRKPIQIRNRFTVPLPTK